MRAYIIEYRYFDAPTNSWISKISQEGYTSIEAAQSFIERKPVVLVAVTPMSYQTEDGAEQYIIHDVLISDTPAQPAPRPTPYERTRAKVYATGNRWAIENFHATHD